RTYADTKPRLARCHVTAPPAEDGGVPDDPPPGGDPPAPNDALHLSDITAQLSAVGPPPATPRIASATVPRLAWTRNERRLMSIGNVMVERWYDGGHGADPGARGLWA